MIKKLWLVYFKLTTVRAVFVIFAPFTKQSSEERNLILNEENSRLGVDISAGPYTKSFPPFKIKSLREASHCTPAGQLCSPGTTSGWIAPFNGLAL